MEFPETGGSANKDNDMLYIALHGKQLMHLKRKFKNETLNTSSCHSRIMKHQTSNSL